MGVGDEILAAGQAQRLFEAMGKRVAICDCDGVQRRWAEIWNGNPILVRPEEQAGADTIAMLRSGPGCRPYIVYPFTKECGWTFNTSFKARDHVAKIYLTAAERARGGAVFLNYGPFVLIEPFTKHPNLRWPVTRWNAVVAACPDLTFVQHTHADAPIVEGAHQHPATFREACGLVASAEVYVRSESGLCHAAAALGVRQVTLFGGCMDPDVLGGYPRQTVIADHEAGSPCGQWEPCDHCRAAMLRVTVEQVVAALREQLAERAVA